MVNWQSVLSPAVMTDTLALWVQRLAQEVEGHMHPNHILEQEKSTYYHSAVAAQAVALIPLPVG